ncbi:MAG: HINT domain-containing protein, partial [Gemmataceae bacterium]|nr:HINT domain-containing protein [Gemmataceae bacterium]
MAPTRAFAYQGKTYVLWTAADKAGVKVKLAQQKGSGFEFRGEFTVKSFYDGGIKDNAKKPSTHFNTLLTAAKALHQKSKTKAPAGTNPLTELKTLEQAVKAAQEVVYQDILRNTCYAVGVGCFAAGTRLWTPNGCRPIEDIRPGEVVFARSENDVDGPVEAKVVEAAFVRIGCIRHLHVVGGQVIRTTPEHPFWAAGRGWTPAGALDVGDEVRTAGGWSRIEDVLDTGEWERVYNLRVADYHTYFVADNCDADAVWAHNAYQVDMAPLNRYIADFKAPGAPDGKNPFTPLSDGEKWLYPVHSLNMSRANWQSFQEDDNTLPMPTDSHYVYLLFDRSQPNNNLEIMMVGKVGSVDINKKSVPIGRETWAQRFGKDNSYRDLAILGASISIYAFDLGKLPTPSAESIETGVRNKLVSLQSGTGRKHWLPYDGTKYRGRGALNPNPDAPYTKAVVRANET